MANAGENMLSEQIGQAQDWQLHRSLQECNKYMLENKIACDAHFNVGIEDASAITIDAHKYMLISRSPVFFTMFCGELPETGSVRVSDVDPAAFKALLHFLYSEKVDLDEDIVLPVLYAAKKYMIPALQEHCIEYLEENLNPDNVCMIYEQSLLYDEHSLIAKCVSFFEYRTDDILQSSTFCGVSLQTLERLLKFDKLSVAEIDLFHASVLWATEECKRKGLEPIPENTRRVLGDTINQIRFPTMSLSDFANIVARSGILTSDEKCEIFEYLTCDEKNKTDMEMKFSTVKRHRPRPSVLKRFTSFGKSNVYTADCSIMKMQCDKTILLKGLGVSGSLGYDPLAEVQVTVMQDQTTLCNCSLMVNDDRSGNIITVPLSSSTLLKPGIWYTIVIMFHFDGEYDQGSCKRGKGGQKIISADNVVFEFDKQDSAGFVPEIFFSKV